jgi:hypothetical protein
LSELPLQLLFPSKQLTELNMNKQGMWTVFFDRYLKEKSIIVG